VPLHSACSDSELEVGEEIVAVEQQIQLSKRMDSLPVNAFCVQFLLPRKHYPYELMTSAGLL
jgi:hypothetical protein